MQQPGIVAHDIDRLIQLRIIGWDYSSRSRCRRPVSESESESEVINLRLFYHAGERQADFEPPCRGSGRAWYPGSRFARGQVLFTLGLQRLHIGLLLDAGGFVQRHSAVLGLLFIEGNVLSNITEVG